VKILVVMAVPVIFLAAHAARANSHQKVPVSTSGSSPILRINDTTQSQLPGSTELPFRLLSGFLIEVFGEIAGRNSLNFVLDTGSTISLVDNRVAAQLHLSLRPAQTLSFGTKTRWQLTTIPEVRFGQIQAKDVDMMVGDLSAFSSYAKGIDAVIGTDLLKLSNFSIDYTTKTIVFHLKLREYARRAAQSPPTSTDPQSDCVILELQIQGHPVKLIVDTGFPGVLLYEERLRRAVPELRFVRPPKPVIMGESLQGQQGVLPDVLLGAHTDQITVFIIHDRAPGQLSGIDGVVGLPPLKARRVHFDFLQKRLSWE